MDVLTLPNMAIEYQIQNELSSFGWYFFIFYEVNAENKIALVSLRHEEYVSINRLPNYFFAAAIDIFVDLVTYQDDARQ